MGKRDKNDLPLMSHLELELLELWTNFSIIANCLPPPLPPYLSSLPFPTQFNGVQVQEEMLNVAFQVLRGDVLASRGQPYMLNWLLEKLY